MNEIALVAASFGGIDDLKSLPRHDGIDAYYYTDALTRAGASPGTIGSWTSVLVPDYPRHDFDGRLRSRYFKQQIHRIDEVQSHRWLVWADGSLYFHELEFIHAEVAKLARLPERDRVLLVPHPQRRTVLEEYEFVKAEMERGNEYMTSRYAREKMTEQMEWFRRRGWNLDARLYAGGFWIIENSEIFHHCWNDWWDQILRFDIQDQLSLPVVLEQHRCRPQTLDVLLWNNPHFRIGAKRFNVLGGG
jgi:hypothetical protein